MDGTFVHILPVGDLLGKAIEISDCPTFLESPAGKTFLDESVAVPLPAGAVLWVPYGFLACPAFAPKIQPTAARNNEVEVPVQHGCFIHMPVMCEKLAAKLQAPVWSAIAEMNSSQLSKVRAQNLWASRADLFASFCAAVAAA